MRSRIQLRQSVLILRSDTEIANKVHGRLIHFLAPLWSNNQLKKSQKKVIINFRIDPARLAPQGMFLFRTRVAEVRLRLGIREIFHFGSVSVRVKERRGNRYITTDAPSAEGLFESAWATLLSVIGEDGDRDGIYRVHALGILDQDKGVLLFSKGGVGKSTFCRKLLERSSIPIFGDEIPLLDRTGCLTANPLPMALSSTSEQMRTKANPFIFLKAFFGNKVLIPLPPQRISPPALVHCLIWMRSASTASLVRVPRWRVALALFRHLVIGEGVPQMAEFFLRLKNLPWLVVIFFGRVQAWIQALRRSEAWILNLSADPEEGWELLNQTILGIQTREREDRQVLCAASKSSKDPSKVFDSDGNLGAMT